MVSYILGFQWISHSDKIKHLSNNAKFLAILLLFCLIFCLIFVLWRQRVTQSRNKVSITDRMWGRLLMSTNQPIFLSPSDIEELKDPEETIISGNLIASEFSPWLYHSSLIPTFQLLHFCFLNRRFFVVILPITSCHARWLFEFLICQFSWHFHPN